MWARAALWAALAASAVCRRGARDVRTAAGAVRGYLDAAAQPPHYAFLGVPYARPPRRRHTQRFKAPEPPPRWDGIFEATHRVRCPQRGDEDADENCLVVNVFVPARAASCCARPVLVHVHDGGFQDGWGAYHPPPKLAEEFVVVTFNFRLGALGFLCLGTPGAPGNAGLKDQVAALYWVKANIGNFGGNPHDVTVYGSGAGAASIQLLLLSGMTRGLVHKAIVESGSALAPPVVTYEPFANALANAVSLGYEDNGDVEELEKFYKEMSLTTLLNASVLFLPCVENNYYHSHSLIDIDPMQILNEGEFHKVPMLIAYTNAKEIEPIEDNQERFYEMPENVEDLLPNNIEFENDYTKYKVSDLVRGYYFKEMFNENLFRNFIDYVNDIFMEYPVMKMAMLYASDNTYPVYVMKFLYGEANYGDIKKLIFSEFSDNDDDEQNLVSDKLVTLWRSFMKMGDPTPLISTLVPLIWQPVQEKNMTDISKIAFLVFDEKLHMNEPDKEQSLTFWDYIYGKFYRKHEFDSPESEFETEDNEEVSEDGE